ncbi:Various polyols ABC transporter, permease component 1 [Pseudonocardia sp. Ae406_Ps2]|uniref:carbohydrate ABC transporter permease n=1 Tax=unclassified Pseudonocardia TaxID=2619320 RepID=UPI0002EA6D8D|nr:Various polyols ABC transporter, permease component 1 [Pseudonocardia sp. Ae406_Ps2]OLM06078.1 Various polyols ABC transporter, permease component 1 [Pseudonocardia sp. Ae331_Ps2]OLM15270.1 Various polyols ABC transporter, permease component 1 [Pseudonocardia sp. Ae505_Ps2]OLM23712.1 Various polyols ABC transporter, permease component 1 [Pseudonocardia sp. Ae706_Ps2]OLM30323.1 Various polyols ABC transporter, permease component 1 [Pseudonocardia sp. Ae717_Ps2]
MTTTEAPPQAAPERQTSPAAQRRDGWIRRAPLLPALIFTIIITQLPFLVTIWYSLQSWNLVRPGSQRFVGLENYATVFTDSQFRGVALNSILLTLGSVAIAMVLGLLIALLLNRAFLGRGIVRTLIITPFLITPVAGALLWKSVLFDPTYGLVNFLLSPFGAGQTDWVSTFPRAAVIIALVWQWTPFMMLLILAGLGSQPQEVLEAARMDGATGFAVFREVTLPHLQRFIELGVVLGAIYLVNTFDTIYMMTQGGPGTASANLPFYIYQRAFLGFDIGESAAMGVVTVVATIIVATLALRLIFRSFSAAEEA